MVIDTTSTVPSGSLLGDMINSSLKAIPPRQRPPTRNEFLVISAIALVFFPIVGILVGWFCRLPEFNAVDPTPADFSGRRVSLSVQLITIDVQAATMSLDWFIVGDPCSRTPNASNCTDVRIFFDANGLLEPDLGEERTNGVPTIPVFTWTPQKNIYGNIPAFRTQLAFFSPGINLLAALQRYPFDEYQATLFVFALDAANGTVGLRIHSSHGVEAGFRVENEIFRDPSDAINYIFTISRGGILKAYAILIMVFVWLITLVFCFAVIFAVFWGRYLEMQLLVIPVTAIFSFTQLRSILPGIATEHSTIIDYVGLLPCFTFLTFGAFLLLGQSLICPEGWKFHRSIPAERPIREDDRESVSTTVLHSDC